VKAGTRLAGWRFSQPVLGVQALTGRALGASKEQKTRGSTTFFAFDHRIMIVEMAASTHWETSVFGEFGAGCDDDLTQIRPLFQCGIGKNLQGVAGSGADENPLPPMRWSSQPDVEARQIVWGRADPATEIRPVGNGFDAIWPKLGRFGPGSSGESLQSGPLNTVLEQARQRGKSLLVCARPELSPCGRSSSDILAPGQQA